jgi:hypothetical protein
MNYDDTIRIRANAPVGLRRGTLASICGITAPADRHGKHWEQFPPGTIYLVEFEDGEALEVHESWVDPAEA